MRNQPEPGDVFAKKFLAGFTLTLFFPLEEIFHFNSGARVPLWLSLLVFRERSNPADDTTAEMFGECLSVKRIYNPRY
jgi:hypothetical protein